MACLVKRIAECMSWLLSADNRCAAGGAWQYDMEPASRLGRHSTQHQQAGAALTGMHQHIASLLI